MRRQNTIVRGAYLRINLRTYFQDFARHCLALRQLQPGGVRT